MSENNPTTNPNEPNAPEKDIDYIEALKKLKANTVSKEEYAKLKLENSKLLNSIINGDEYEQNPVQTKPDINKLRAELFNGEAQLSNLEYATKALALRDAVIESGGHDPFLPYGSKVMPTNDDIEAANRVAAVMQECIEYAKGDSGVFTAELQRRTVNTAPNKR